jgi:hypothetical protein
VTGQPGRPGPEQPDRDRDDSADAGSRSSGNWHEAVDDHDAAHGQDTDQRPGQGAGRDANPRPGRGAGRDANPRPGRGAGRDTNARPGRGANARPGRDTGQSPNPRPGRDAGESPPPRPPRQPSIDLTADIQRWLIRSGARNVRRELNDQFRKAWSDLRGEPTKPAEIWNTATTEPPPPEQSEAPECAWCPVCRAARRIRETGPGLGGQLAGAGDAVAAAVQEALSMFDSVLSARPRPEPAGRSARPAGDDRPEASAPGAPSEGPDHEPDDRD